MIGNQHSQQTSKNQPQLVINKTDRNIPIHYPQFSGEIENIASSAYDKRLYYPILETVLLEFGVGRRKFLRSKEVNDFRQIMKDTAREQSYNDIDKLVKDSTETANDSILMKFRKSNLAKKDAHQESKAAVNDAMTQQAKTVIKSVVEEVSTTTSLVKESVAKVDLSNPKEKVIKQFTSVVDKQAKQTEATASKVAVTEAKKLVAQVKTDNQAGKLNDKANLKGGTSSTDLLLNVQKSAATQGEKSFKKFAAINESSIYSSFAKVAILVEQLVPNIGDSAAASFELNIPIGPGLLVINIGANCEHDEEELDVAGSTQKQEYYTVGAEINIGGGAGIKKDLVEAVIKGTVGMFMESTGKQAEHALTLISYGIYRILFNRAPKLSSAIWGNGGKTGFDKFQEAEMWAAMVEKNMLNDEHSKVMIGLQAGVSAEAGSTDKYKKSYALKGEGALNFQKYYEYSKKVLDNATIEHGDDLETLISQSNHDILNKIKPNNSTSSASASQQSNTTPNDFNALLVERKKKFKDNIHHKSKVSLSASTEFKFGKKAGFGCEIEGSILFNHDSKDSNDLSQANMKFDTLEFSINVSFPEKVDKLVAFNQILPKVSDFATSIIGSKILASTNDKDKTGLVVGREASLAVVNTALQSYVSQLKVDDTPFKDAWGSSLSAGFNFVLDLLGDDSSIDFEIRRTQEHSFDFNVGNFAVEKSKRIYKKSLL